MPKFDYHAMNSEGKEIRGVIEAESVGTAIVKIKELGCFPTEIFPVKETAAAGRADRKGMPVRRKGTSSAKINTKQLTIFTRQLAILIDAGLPLVRSLTILRDQQKKGGFQRVIGSLAEEVEGGSTFSEALAKFPGIFSRLFVNMVKAGEVGGVLEVVLQRLAEFAESSQKIAGKVKSALAYPMVVVCVAGGALTFMLTTVVPKFLEMFVELEIALPPMTQGLMNVSTFLRKKWYVGLGVVIGFVVVFRIIKRNRIVKYYLDNLMLLLPVFGPLGRKVAVGNFARMLGTLVQSGVPILQALNIVKDTTGNEVLARAISNVHNSIREGESIAGPLLKSRVFPLMVVNMVDVGEETGSLDTMLLKVADAYESEVEATVGALTSLLEPLLIVVVGLIVGLIVVSMFLPLVTLISKMSMQTG